MRLTKVTLALLLFTAPAYAGTLTDFSGNYRMAAQNPQNCPQDTGLTLATDAAESSLTATYSGSGPERDGRIPGPTTYVLGQRYELPSMPFHRYMRFVMKDSKLVSQTIETFQFFWQDNATYFDFDKANQVTAHIADLTCVFERI